MTPHLPLLSRLLQLPQNNYCFGKGLAEFGFLLPRRGAMKEVELAANKQTIWVAENSRFVPSVEPRGRYLIIRILF
jgi:hypothetical protein